MIAITHPIKQQICNQYIFLSSMLERFPSLLEDWIQKQEEEIEQIAKEEAKGDMEVYSSIKRSSMSFLEECDDEEQLFNQSMLIMVFSYYESFLCRLAKECDAKSARPSVIAEKKGDTLDEELIKIAVFLHERILPLRNQLCHNNNGTLFSRNAEDEKAIEILKEMKYISVDDGRISIIDKSFIQKTLESEYKLLLRLANICGFRTKFIV